MGLILEQVFDEASDITGAMVKANKICVWANDDIGRTARVMLRIYITGLNGAAATLTIKPQLTEAGASPAIATTNGPSHDVIKAVAADTTIWFEVGPYLVKHNGILAVKAQSTNLNDIEVDTYTEVIDTQADVQSLAAYETLISDYGSQSSTVFRVDNAPTGDDIPNGWVIEIENAITLITETRYITDYDAGNKEVTVDRALSFAPADNDVCRFLRGVYAHVNAVAVGGDSPPSLADIKEKCEEATSMLVTTVAVEDSNTSFTLTDGYASADTFVNSNLLVRDSDDHYEIKKITGWTAGKVVTVDGAYKFLPTVGDVAIILRIYSNAATETKQDVIDGIVDTIVTDTNEIQGKLPTNKFMGSSDGADDDGVLNAIAGYLDSEVAAIVAAVITNAAGVDIAADIIALKAETAAILADTGTTLENRQVTIAADAARLTAARAAVLTDLINGGRLDLLIDAINAKTTNLPGAPAAIGSEMKLENDGITSAKYDESTAFPVKSADTGDTTIARKGSGSETLTTVKSATQATKLASDGLDSISTTEPAAGGSLDFREIILCIYRFIFGKTKHHKTAPGQGEFTLYKEDGSTGLLEQSTSDDGTDQDKSEAAAP